MRGAIEGPVEHDLGGRGTSEGLVGVRLDDPRREERRVPRNAARSPWCAHLGLREAPVVTGSHSAASALPP
jgi:hypothetical protein